jgi:hypothetical protein
MSGSDDQFRIDYQTLLGASADLQSSHDTDVQTVNSAMKSINQAISTVASLVPSFTKHATGETSLIQTRAQYFLGKYKDLADQIEQSATDAMSAHQHLKRMLEEND